MNKQHQRRKGSITYHLQVKYSLMKRRAIRKQMTICSQEEFMAFGLADMHLKELISIWIDSGFQRKLSPSIDRIDNTKGYTLENMQFITHSQNVSKGNREAPRSGAMAQAANKKKIRLIKENQELIFESGKSACDFLELDRTRVSRAIKNKHRLKGYKVCYV